MRMPRVTILGFGVLAGLALAIAGLGFTAPAAWPAGAGALAALAGAFLVVELTFTQPLAVICGPGAGDALERLAEFIEKTRQSERTTAEAVARRLADARAAEAAENILEAGARARSALAQPIAAALRALAEGDLTQVLEAPELAREYKAAIALYGKTVFAFSSSADAIGARARDITGNAAALGEQAEGWGRRIAPAREALQLLAQRYGETAAYSRKAEQAIIEMRRMKDQARAALVAGAAAMKRLVGARSRIAEIAERIDGYAFQTHIIAVNASVESAHAGEAGRGVALLAQELRTLSQQTAESTRELTTALTEAFAEAGERAKALREAERALGASAAIEATAPIFDMKAPLSALEAALAASDEAASEGSRTGAEVGAASRSLEALVAKLAALANHFHCPGAEAFARSAPAESDITSGKPLRLPRALPWPSAPTTARVAAPRLRAV